MYYFVRLLAIVAAWLPLSWCYPIAVGLGELSWLLVPLQRRKLAIDNIMAALAVDRQTAATIAKASVTRFGRMVVEVFRQHCLTATTVKQHVCFKGQEHLDAALAAANGGVVIATAHSGNWELLSAALTLTGYPIAAIAQKQHNASMDRFINEQRRACGAEVVYRSAVRDMVRLLEQGKCIGLLMDQDARRDGIFVPFFGRAASTPQGSAAIARLRNAPVVPIFIRELAWGKHEIIIHPALKSVKTANRDADIYQLTCGLTAVIEDHIRAYPTEWFWLHNRWKTKEHVSAGK